MCWSILNKRDIIDILIGDANVYEEHSLPYLSGPSLCSICTAFGLPRTYTWHGSNLSRWMYMQELLEYLEKQNRVQELICYLFDIKQFESLAKLKDPKIIKDTYKCIVDGALKAINATLFLSNKELRILGKQFVLANVGEEIHFEAPNVKVISSQYIRELPDRIKADIENQDYDSVITKSRTLLEEVLIFIIEKLTFERYKSSGDLVKIYQDATELLNMRQKGDWDKRINELLGGLHKIVGAISSMRNINSDAHGAGSGRIEINEREAMLASQSSMILAEYWLGVYEKKVGK